MAEYELYVERLAHNGALLMAMTEGEVVLAPELAAEHGEVPLREGLEDLRGLLAALYADMGAEPAAWGIPRVPDSKVWEAASRRKARGPSEAPLKLLYALGLSGELRDGALVAGEAALATEAGGLGVRDMAATAGRLERVGLAVEVTGGEVVCRGGGTALVGLAAFARVCRLWEREGLKARRLPDVFAMADYRVLARADQRVTLPKPSRAELMCFAPAALRDDLEATARHAEGLGYRASVRTGNPLDGEWYIDFVGGKPRRGLMGVTLCRGRVDLRLICSDSAPLAPHIAACPPGLRDDLIEGSCAHCGGAGCGREVYLDVEGEQRPICRFGNLRVSRWDAEGLAAYHGLMTVLAGRHSRP